MPAVCHPNASGSPTGGLGIRATKQRAAVVAPKGELGRSLEPRGDTVLLDEAHVGLHHRLRVLPQGCHIDHINSDAR
eukprot:2937816-Alexandrium_andersonii.AAC.1